MSRKLLPTNTCSQQQRRGLFLSDDHHSAREGQALPVAPSRYFLATTIVLIVAVTPSTTSTTTM
jgi:hypothetical protein